MRGARAKTTQRGTQPLLAGRVMAALADSFRVGPMLANTVGRQLREWEQGLPKERRTQRKIVRAILEAAFLDPTGATRLGSDLSDEELVEIALRVLLGWCTWVDALRPTGVKGPDFLAKLVVERTLIMWGLVLGTVRHAWGVPLRAQPTLAYWFPTGRDRKSVPSVFLDEVFRRVEQRPNAITLVERLAAARPGGGGKALKPATLRRWRSGETLPNGERVTAIAHVDGDRQLRVKLGVRVAVERLAALHADGGEPSRQNRDATMLWLAFAECRAHEMQTLLAARHASDVEALRLLGDPRLLKALLPPREPPSR